MKTRRRETPGRSHTPCWSPSRRRATQRRVSNPDCAVDARPHSRREQDHPLAAPSVFGSDSRLCARSLASAFSGNACELLSSESVADSGLRLNQRWFCWIRLDLLAQMRDVNAQVLAMLLGLRAPDFAQDVAMREY